MVKDKNHETFYWACEKKQPENCIMQRERHFQKATRNILIRQMLQDIPYRI